MNIKGQRARGRKIEYPTNNFAGADCQTSQMAINVGLETVFSRTTLTLDSSTSSFIRRQMLGRGSTAPIQEHAWSTGKKLSFALYSPETARPSSLSVKRGSLPTGYLRTVRGFSLFELVVVIGIVAVLAGIFISSMQYYQEQAEKTAMTEVAGAIQTALFIQYGEVMTRGKTSDIAWLKTDNPMNWLQQKPRNYAGEFYDPSPLSVEPGNWVFDLKSRDLIFVLNIANNFKPGKDGKNWIRYHVSIKYESSRLPSLQDAPPELTGVQFEPTEPYSWF